MSRSFLAVWFGLLFGLYSWGTTWGSLNGITVGSSSGNMAKMNSITIGTSSGNYTSWNGLVVGSSLAPFTIVNHGTQQGNGAGFTSSISLNCNTATGYAVGISAYLNTVTGVTVTDLESHSYSHFTQLLDGSSQSAVNWYYILNITGNSSEVFSITADYSMAEAVCFTAGGTLTADGNSSTNTACITSAIPFCVLPIITPTASGDLMLMMSSMSTATTTFMAAGSLIDPLNYVSGLAVIGTASQTCNFASFDGGGSGATASVVLDGINHISAQVATITANGSGYTTAPTTATPSAGTAASCTGTPVLTGTVSYPILLDQATLNAGQAYGGAAYAKIKTDSAAESPTIDTITSASLGAAVMLMAIKHQ